MDAVSMQWVYCVMYTCMFHFSAVLINVRAACVMPSCGLLISISQKLENPINTCFLFFIYDNNLGTDKSVRHNLNNDSQWEECALYNVLSLLPMMLKRTESEISVA